MSFPYNDGDWLLSEFYRNNGEAAVPVRMVGRDHALAHREHMARLDKLRSDGFTVKKETCGNSSCESCKRDTYHAWCCVRGNEIRIVLLVKYRVLS